MKQLLHKTTILLFLLFTISFQLHANELNKDIDVNSSEEEKLEYMSYLFDFALSKSDSTVPMILKFQQKIKPNEYYVQIKLNTIAATYYWNTGRLDTAVQIYRTNLQLSKLYHIKDQEVNAMSNLGAILNVMGEIDSAYFYLKNSLPLAESLNNTKLANKIRFDLGNYYKRKGYYHLALEQLHIAEKYYSEKLGDNLIVYVYNTMGNVYKDLGNFTKAKKYYKEAIAIDSAQDNVFLLHDLFNNLGVAYWKLSRNYDSAKYYVQKAYDISLEFDSPNHQFVYLLNLGGIESDLGNLNQSLKLLKKAESLKLNYEDSYTMSALLINLATVNAQLHHYQLAYDYYERGIELAKPLNYYDNLVNAYGGLMRMDSTQAKYLSALKFSRTYNIYKDSLESESVKKRVAELEIIHDLEQKELDNQMLHEKNSLQSEIIKKQRTQNLIVFIGLLILVLFSTLLLINRKRLKKAKYETEIKNNEITEQKKLIEQVNLDLEKQKEELLVLNQTKDKFFTVVAHDLRNPFSSLLGLLDLLETDFNELDDNKKLEIIESLNKNGRNTYSLLINLLDWAKSQRGLIEAKLDKVNVQDVIQSSLSFLKQRIEDKEHHVLSRTEGEIKIVADTNLLTSVLINIINNAVKFTKRGGEIVIDAMLKDKKAIISISDNGVGIKKETIEQLFSISSKNNSKGTEDELGTGLGLIISKEFVDLMNGRIWVESEEGKGTTFFVELALANE